jgi:hypothetical protein
MNLLTEKEMKKLSRTDLLRMLIDQGEEMKVLKEELEKAKAEISEREIKLTEAGSIAEAALKINGVFEAAQAASQQYLENVKHLSERQDALARIKERETREKCERQILETKEKCDAMIAKAEKESKVYWEDVSKRLEKFYNEHIGLRELLSTVYSKKEQEEK